MRSRRARVPGPLGLVAALAVLAACTAPAEPRPASPTSAASATTGATSAPTATVVLGTPRDIATDLDVPWSVVAVHGVPLVSERDTGRILEVLGDGSTREVAVVAGVVHGGEGGLLGLAVDDADRLFVYSTGTDGNRIQRYPLRGAPGNWSLGAPVTILDGLPSGSNHNGGRIEFGPDGMLYAGVGDAGVPAHAQDLDSLAGKILRLTPDGEVPEDNPFPGSLVYSYGHRNVQGLAWTDDGTMFATEFGQDTWDELNVIEPGGNYGWPEVEGVAGEPGFVDPVQQWRPVDASPSGMARVDGALVIANLRGEVLRTVPTGDPSTSTEYLRGRLGRLRAVVPAPDGDLWVLTNNTARGAPRPGDDRLLSIPLD